MPSKQSFGAVRAAKKANRGFCAGTSAVRTPSPLVIIYINAVGGNTKKESGGFYYAAHMRREEARWRCEI